MTTGIDMKVNADAYWWVPEGGVGVLVSCKEVVFADDPEWPMGKLAATPDGDYAGTVEQFDGDLHAVRQVASIDWLEGAETDGIDPVRLMSAALGMARHIIDGPPAQYVLFVNMSSRGTVEVYISRAARPRGRKP